MSWRQAFSKITSRVSWRSGDYFKGASSCQYSMVCSIVCVTSRSDGPWQWNWRRHFDSCCSPLGPWTPPKTTPAHVGSGAQERAPTGNRAGTWRTRRHVYIFSNVLLWFSWDCRFSALLPTYWKYFDDAFIWAGPFFFLSQILHFPKSLIRLLGPWLVWSAFIRWWCCNRCRCRWACDPKSICTIFRLSLLPCTLATLSHRFIKFFQVR